MKACTRCGRIWWNGDPSDPIPAHPATCDTLRARADEYASVGGFPGAGQDAFTSLARLVVGLLLRAGWGVREARRMVTLKHDTLGGRPTVSAVLAPAWVHAMLPRGFLPIGTTAEREVELTRRLATLRRAGHDARARMAVTFRLGGLTAADAYRVELERLYPPETRR